MKVYTLFAVIEVLLIILIVLFDIKWLISVLLLYLFLIPFLFALFEDSLESKKRNEDGSIN